MTVNIFWGFLIFVSGQMSHERGLVVEEVVADVAGMPVALGLKLKILSSNLTIEI